MDLQREIVLRRITVFAGLALKIRPLSKPVRKYFKDLYLKQWLKFQGCSCLFQVADGRKYIKNMEANEVLFECRVMCCLSIPQS